MKEIQQVVFTVVLIFGFFATIGPAHAIGSADVPSREQLAALSAYFDSLRNLLLSLESFIPQTILSASAQTVSSTQPAPTNLYASYAPSAGYVNLYWTDSSNSAWGASIFRKLSTDTAWVGSFSSTAWATSTSPYNRYAHSDIYGLSPGSYDYKIFSCASTCSDYSNVSTVTITASNQPPPSPSGFSGSPISVSTNSPYTYSTTIFPDPNGDQVRVSVDWKDGSPVSVSQFISIPTTGYTFTFPHTWATAGTFSTLARSEDVLGATSIWIGVGTFTVSNPSDTTPPSTPTGLMATAMSASQTNLYWTPSTDNVGVTGYKVYRNSVYLTNATSAFYFDTGIASSSTYSYTVAAYDAAGNISPQSGSVSATTSSSSISSGSPPIPSTPTPFSYSGRISISYTFSTYLYPSPNGYQVKATFDWGDGTTSDSSSGLITPATNGTSVSASHHWSASGVYSIKVKAIDTNSLASLWSSPASMTIGTPPNPPSLTYVTVNGSNATMVWTESSTNVNGFKLYRKMTSPNISLQALPDQGSTVTSYADNGFPAGTGLAAGTYDYYLQSYNLSGGGSYPIYSDISNVITVVVAGTSSTSTASLTAPAAPSNLNSSLSKSGTQVNLSWQDNSNNETRFEIYRSMPGGSWAYLTQVGANTTNFSETPNAGSYYYQVAACNGSAINTGCSSGSNIVVVTTNATTYATTTMATTPPPTSSTTTTTTTYATTTTTTTIATTSPGFLQGSAHDKSGQVIVGAYLHIFNASLGLNFSTITQGDGSFSGVSLQGGTYIVEAWPPSSRPDLLKPDPQTIAITSNQTQTLNITFTAAAKTIVGQVLFSNGAPVTDAEVGAYSSASGQWISTLTDSRGNFTLSVGGGTWQVGIRPKDPSSAQWSSPSQFPQATFANDSVAQAQTVNFTIPLASATLSLHAIDQNGNAFLGAGMIVSTVSAGQTSPSGSGSSVFKTSDANGNAIFSLQGATIYYIRGYVSPTSGYVNPDEQSVSLNPGDTKALSLMFHKQTVASTFTLSGITKISDGTPTNAFIWGWSEQGATKQAHADTNGNFSMALTAGLWHIGASNELNNIPYESSVVTVNVQNNISSLEVILSRAGGPLPATVNVSQPTTQQIVAQASDGASVTIPQNATVSVGNITVSVNPTTKAPSQAGAKVVSTVYDIDLTSASGAQITSLQKQISITIPYDPVKLAAQKISPSELSPSYYDELTGTWVRVGNYVIDEIHHVVVIKVQHLTRFALVAAADITPPDAPTKISVVAVGPGEIDLSWQSPISDFDHVKIYRSTIANTLGTIISNDTAGSSAKDTEVSAGVRYYYTLRAVDPAGNESTNITQVWVIAQGTLTGTATFSRNLKVGSRGNDVSALQIFLLKEKVYPEGIASGYFGKLTKAAVIRFQEKYTDEILKPNGLGHGTGIVGPATRVKLNQLRESQ